MVMFIAYVIFVICRFLSMLFGYSRFKLAGSARDGGVYFRCYFNLD